jgi:hypothetical protein
VQQMHDLYGLTPAAVEGLNRLQRLSQQ